MHKRLLIMPASTSGSTVPPRYRLRHSSLPLKIAAWVAAGVGLATVAAASADVGLSWTLAFALPLVAALVTYTAAFFLLVPRLALAHATLRQVRKQQFEDLEAARIPKGDELNALIWQVYRTGLILEKEIQELQRVESHRRDFLGNVSHELKTPIFAIQGFAETLLDGALTDERVNRTFVKKIHRNSIRLRNMARDLAEISRIETGESQMTEGPFTLQQLVREVIESMEPLGDAKELTLTYDVPPGLPPARGDAERIRQVLINLIENAIRYNTEGGQVTVSARREDDTLRVEVADDGVGIPPQHIPRLTERFYRVDESRARNRGGSGLGLAIVKHILSAHGQQLQVDSTPGVGSTFAFHLPQHSRDAPLLTQPPSRQTAPTTS